MPNKFPPGPSVLRELHTNKNPSVSNSEGKKWKTEPMKITEQSFLSFQPTYQLLQPIHQTLYRGF
jgi:hypothetical protein